MKKSKWLFTFASLLISTVSYAQFDFSSPGGMATSIILMSAASSGDEAPVWHPRKINEAIVRDLYDNGSRISINVQYLLSQKQKNCVMTFDQYKGSKWDVVMRGHINTINLDTNQRVDMHLKCDTLKYDGYFK